MRILLWGAGLKERCALFFFFPILSLVLLWIKKKNKKTAVRQIPQSRCSAAGEGNAAEQLRGDARRQDLLLLDVHKTCTPMLTLLHSSVACVSVGAPAWDCLVVHFLAREFSGLELSFKLCGWPRTLQFNDVWEERGADKGGYSSTRGDVWRMSARAHTPRLMGPGSISSQAAG